MQEAITYISTMDWKEKLKWKLLVILIALIGILVVWCAGKAGEKKGHAEQEILKEYAVRENEWASAGAVACDGKAGAREENREKDQGTDQGKNQGANPGTDQVEDQKTEQEKDQKEKQKADGDMTEGSAETEAGASAQPSYGNGPNIRVLLMTNGYEGYYHSEISFQAQGVYEIQGADTKKLENGETLKLTPGCEELKSGSLMLLPEQEDNRITVTSLNRGQGNPSYPGSITVYQDENGLHMVNELPLEQYLCGVVPSEMPASYHLEALKAQAVCARTYASVQMQGSKLKDLGAQVDDSVSFQVYQNSKEADSSTRAVMETAGQVLLNQGKPIQAYYFSTSHGKTSTDEVWEASVPSSYLKSVECSYDASEPWYQWQVDLSMEKLTENTKKLFPDTAQAKSLEIREKGEGDAVLHLEVDTDQGKKELHSEYDIRTLLAPLGLAITRQDGSQVKGSSLLPSAYFTLEERKGADGSLNGYRIYGGGYGHGVGMSQNGAKGMADAGKLYYEILSYFYKDVELGNLNTVVNNGDS